MVHYVSALSEYPL